MTSRPYANNTQNAEETAYEGQTDSQSNENCQKAPETLESFAKGNSLHGARFCLLEAFSENSSGQWLL